MYDAAYDDNCMWRIYQLRNLVWSAVWTMLTYLLYGKLLDSGRLGC